MKYVKARNMAIFEVRTLTKGVENDDLTGCHLEDCLTFSDHITFLKTKIHFDQTLQLFKAQVQRQEVNTKKKKKLQYKRMKNYYKSIAVLTEEERVKCVSVCVYMCIAW